MWEFDFGIQPDLFRSAKIGFGRTNGEWYCVAPEVPPTASY